MRRAYPTMPTRRCGAALALLLAMHAGPLAAQEGAAGLDARVRALAAERLAPLLEALDRPAAPALPEGVRFLVRAAGNVQGLTTGAPVTIRGLRIGTVREVTVTFDSGKGQLEVPVVIDIVPGSLVVDGARPDTAEALRAAVATLVERGLRAQLASPSLLSASQEIALDLAPEAPPASLGDGPVPEIPSLPTRFDAMSATLDRSAGGGRQAAGRPDGGRGRSRPWQPCASSRPRPSCARRSWIWQRPRASCATRRASWRSAPTR